MDAFFSNMFNFSEVFTPGFYSALLAIILIDLALAGDNALVIGLAARRLPPEWQKKVLFWGSVAAVAVRAMFTLIVVWLLKIPGFLIAGGLILLVIAYRLVQPGDAQNGEGESEPQSELVQASLRQAIMTVVIADAAMGIENVVAIGGAAHGSFLLVTLGLLISVPIIMFGAQMVVRLVERYPHIITLGGAILAWTAMKMIFSEGFVKEWAKDHHWLKVLMFTLAIGIVVMPTLWRTWSPLERKRYLMLGLMVLWLVGFDMLEQWLNMHPAFEPGWHAGEEVVDLIMYVGWVPVMLGVERLLSKPQEDQ
ncbi:MAG: hypothetical protein RLZZ502_470 [Pseudomonadota bacterium]